MSAENLAGERNTTGRTARGTLPTTADGVAAAADRSAEAVLGWLTSVGVVEGCCLPRCVKAGSRALVTSSALVLNAAGVPVLALRGARGAGAARATVLSSESLLKALAPFLGP